MTVYEAPFQTHTDWGWIVSLIGIKSIIFTVVCFVLMIASINKKVEQDKRFFYYVLSFILFLGPVGIWLFTDIYTKYIAFFPVNIIPIVFSVSGICLLIISKELDVFGIVPISVWNAINMNENKIILFDKNDKFILANDSFMYSLDIPINNYTDFIAYLEARYNTLFSDLHNEDKEYILDVVDKNNSAIFYQLISRKMYSKKNKFVARFISIENITKYRELITLKEREEISNNIHGYLDNKMVALIYMIKISQEINNQKELELYLDRLLNSASSVHMTIRRIVENMSPVNFEKYGFITPVKSLIDKFGLQGIYVNFFCSDEIEDLDTNYKMAIYEIIQESITNAIIHGKAKEMEISVQLTSNFVNLKIFDHGVGCEKVIWIV